jgi:hypothetical protein
MIFTISELTPVESRKSVSEKILYIYQLRVYLVASLFEIGLVFKFIEKSKL